VEGAEAKPPKRGPDKTEACRNWGQRMSGLDLVVGLSLALASGSGDHKPADAVIPVEETHKSAHWKLSHPWHRADAPMKDEQFKRDWARCEASAKSASIGEKTELRFEVVLVECLEGVGYQAQP
jgi:hypothetical protein